ncbi:uncharacterized protein LOC101453379 [Ceratitis capitata]|nr:uncharacterized protein LOC101453379 [Ceratitis capitata]
MVVKSTNAKGKPKSELAEPSEIETTMTLITPNNNNNSNTTTTGTKSNPNNLNAASNFGNSLPSTVGESTERHCLITVDDGNDRLTGKTNAVATTSNTKGSAYAATELSDVPQPNCLIANESGETISSGSSTDTKNKPLIPDGGYGWVVVCASLVVSLIADGLGFSFGLINSELLTYFGESAAKTAWISSLFFSVPLLMGPIWSNLVDRYGCRRMTIFGGILSATGFALSSMCNSVEMLMLTFGIISGLGLGISFVTAVVSIAFWFDKKRTFATGIAASGTGIGTILYAPLTQSLIDSYGWRIATLILAGTILNTSVSGALMRDPDWLIEEKRLEKEAEDIADTYRNSIVNREDIRKMLDTGASKEAVLESLVAQAHPPLNRAGKNDIKRLRSEMFFPTFLGSQNLDCIYETNSNSRRSSQDADEDEVPAHELVSSTGNLDKLNCDTTQQTNKNDIAIQVQDNLVKQNNSTTQTPMPESTANNEKRKYIRSNSKSTKLVARSQSSHFQQTGSLPPANTQKNVQMHRTISRERSALLSPYRHRTNSCPNIPRNPLAALPKVTKNTWYDAVIDALKTSFDFSLFADIKFSLFNLATLFLFIWFIIPYLYLPEYMKIHGYEAADSAHLISIIGIAQTIGMIFLGYIGDRPWLNVNICYSVCMGGMYKIRTK